MHLFSKRPSKEAGLQRIYTEAYQSSLQSILKESSFEFRDSLDSWKQTLAQITSGMAQLDGSPPRTAQEKSLLASIMDIERQCHDRIAALEIRLHNARVTAGTEKGTLIPKSPYGTHVSNSSAANISELTISGSSTGSDTHKKKPQRIAVGAKVPRPDQVKSEPSLTPVPPPHNTDASQTSGIAGSGGSSSTSSTHQRQPSQPSSPAFDFTDKFSTQMPRVSEMPYNLYAKKTNTTTSSSYSPLTRSAPALIPEKNAAMKQKSQQPSSHHSQAQTTSQAQIQTQTQAYNQPQPHTPKQQSQSSQPQAHRSSLDYPQPAPAPHGHSLLSTLRPNTGLKTRSRHTSGNHSATPSPRSSAESVAALAAAKQTVAAASSKTEPPAIQFAGFEGTFRSDAEATSPTLQSPVEFSGPGPTLEPSKSATSSLNSSSPSASQLPKQAPQKKTQFHVAYDKIPTASGRIVYRPRVVRTPVGEPHTHSNSPSQSFSSSSTSLAQGGASSQSRHQSASSQSQTQPPALPSRGSQGRILADGKPEANTDAEDLEGLDDWDKMVREKIKDLRGVDKAAAEQIVNEVVHKGDEVNWDDIAGLEKAKASLKETVVYPFLRPDLFMGLREPVLGMLLFGPPGTGKTMLARAVATESKSTFFSISASSLTSKYMGESEKLVRALFQLAKALAPSIIFVDEIDSILTQRADSGEHEASRRIKNEFLVQWSDLQAAAAGKSNQDAQVRRVLVLGATNLPWAIDEAARRRFVRRQYIPLPEPFTRRVHLEKLLSHQKHALTNVDLNSLVELTDGYSGSDLTALAKDAAMGPLRSLGDALLTTAPDQIRPMGMSDFVESMRSIRPSVSSEGLRAFEQWADMYGSSGA